MQSSQSQLILQAIRNSIPNGIANYELSHISLDYTARISELRKEGHNIVAVRQWNGKRATNTYRYFLAAPVQVLSQPTMFDKLKSRLRVGIN